MLLMLWFYNFSVKLGLIFHDIDQESAFYVFFNKNIEKYVLIDLFIKIQFIKCIQIFFIIGNLKQYQQ